MGIERRGFASLDPAARRRVASLGGKAAHAQGTGHEWTSTEAKIAGSKGGKAVAAKRRGLAVPDPVPVK